jgi:hypothetical protein
MRLVLWGSIAALIGTVGCTRTNADRDAGAHPTDMGMPAVDVGHDAPTTACTADPQCNDSIGCTIDQCIVGNVCQNMPINGMCNVAGGEHCEPGVGCTTMTTTTCNSAAECDDHIFCNGVESCVLHECFHDPAGRNCDDGNACTIDTCDESIAHCAYTTTCDSGVVTTDTGPACTAFTAPADFSGMFFISPAQNQGCGTTMYSLGSISVAATGTNITITGLSVESAAATMTGTSTGNSFTATYTGRCGTYTLTGTFASCRESFMGHWSTSLHCTCPATNADVMGIRTGG